MMIDSFVVEKQTKKGEWERISLPFGIHDGTIFIGQDLKKVVEAKYGTFEAAIQDKNISANETVRGWLLFTQWPPSPFRMTVKDATGQSFTEPITQGWSSGWPAQPFMMEITKNYQDISNLPMMKIK